MLLHHVAGNDQWVRKDNIQFSPPSFSHEGAAFLNVRHSWNRLETFPAPPPPTLALSPLPLHYTLSRTFTLQMPRRWRRSPYCHLPRAGGSAGRRGKSWPGRAGPAATAGSTSSGKLPAEAAASAGWPAASQPLSPLQSVSWVDGKDEGGDRGRYIIRSAVPLSREMHRRSISCGSLSGNQCCERYSKLILKGEISCCHMSGESTHKLEYSHTLDLETYS